MISSLQIWIATRFYDLINVSAVAWATGTADNLHPWVAALSAHWQLLEGSTQRSASPRSPVPWVRFAPSQGSAFDGDSACLARILLGRLAWDLVDALAAVGAEYRFLLAAVTITVTGV